jgi:hypothetical protein
MKQELPWPVKETTIYQLHQGTPNVSQLNIDIYRPTFYILLLDNFLT